MFTGASLEMKKRSKNVGKNVVTTSGTVESFWITGGNKNHDTSNLQSQNLSSKQLLKKLSSRFVVALLTAAISTLKSGKYPSMVNGFL